MKKFLRNNPYRLIPVVFLDNSPLHKSSKIYVFFLRNGIMLIFNLTNNPKGNPIELLWRFIKKPFRTKTDATR